MRFESPASLLAAIGVLVGLAATPAAAGAGRPAPALEPRLATLPLSFEENRGQSDPRVRFLARGPGYVAFLTDEEAVLRLEPTPGRAEARPAALRMRLIGSDAQARLQGRDELRGRSHYLGAADRRQWVTDVRHYARVDHRRVYPGIDVTYYGNADGLAFDFLLAPGADPGRIALAYAGAESLALDASGALRIETAAGTLVQRAPFAYQERDGVREPVRSRFRLRDGRTVVFELGAYDRERPLVIDPTLAYSTLLGPGGVGKAIAVDADGAAYVTGFNSNADFPVTAGALDTSFDSGAFVTKLDPTGSFLVYSTYLGDRADDAADIAVDADGQAYVIGSGAPLFRTANAVEDDIQPFYNQVFVAKLSADGSDLLYATILPSDGGGYPGAIAVGANGLIYATGRADGSFPIKNGFQTTNGGISDAFLTVMDPNAPADPDPAVEGESLVYSTLIGGPIGEAADAIAVDANGDAVITGLASGSPTFPFPVKNAIQPSAGGGSFDAWVAKFDPSKTGEDSLLFSTYLGGSGAENGYARNGGIAVDAAGDIYVTGTTTSPDFPTTPGVVQPVFNSSSQAFVTKLTADGSAMLWSTYLGGGGLDQGFDVAVDARNDVFVSGYAGSLDFPVKDAFQPTKTNSADGFVSVLLPDASDFIFSTYLGGGGGVADTANGIAVDTLGSAYVTGQTAPGLPPFPTTPGAYLESLSSGSAYVTKFPPVIVPPVADAGSDQSVDEAAPVQLDGSASTNATGYLWTQVAGPAVTLDDDTSATPGFTAPYVSANVTLTFSLVVDDGSLVSDPDTVDVTVVNVNNPPVADAGDDATIKEGAVATLDASASFDPEGDSPLGYAWSQVAGPAVVLSPSANVVSPTFTAPLGVGTVLEFEVVVDDGREASAPDAVVVTVVENSPPVADAGPDQMVDEGSLVQLAGSGSDPDGGDTIAFAWSQLSGPTVVLSDASSPSPSFDAPPVGPGGEDVALELTVTDDDPVHPLSGSDQVVVSVRDVNDPPDCSGAFGSESFLWPPDHHMQEISILGVMDPDSPANAITIQITGVTQDEPVNGLGDGDSSPDAVILDGDPADTVLIRRERAGPGDGRVYVIEFTASDGVDSCTGSVLLETPSSRRGTPAIDSGQLFDSTQE